MEGEGRGPARDVVKWLLGEGEEGLAPSGYVFWLCTECLV